MDILSAASLRARRICSGVSRGPIVISKLRRPPRMEAWTISRTWVAEKPRRIPTMGNVESKFIAEAGKDEAVGRGGGAIDGVDEEDLLLWRLCKGIQFEQ